MADQVVSGDSKQAVAFALLLGIAHKQQKTYTLGGIAIVSADEDWVFKTYAKCLRVADGVQPEIDA